VKTFSPAQLEIILHRLELVDCIAQVLASTEANVDFSDEQSDDEFNERVRIAQARLQPKVFALLEHVSAHRKLPDEMDADTKEIIAEAIEGSTWFVNEGWSSVQTPLWWAGQHRAAEVIERIVSAAVGRCVRFPNR